MWEDWFEMSFYHRYTKEEIKWLADHVKGIRLEKLTNTFNKTFGLAVTKNSIAMTKNRYGLKSGVHTNGYKKGCIPWNKGTKGLTNGSSTSFKKGCIPPHTKPIGSERINKYGFTEVKIASPKEWKLKHRLIYEQYHGVKVGRWDKVIFLDGNKRNVNIENLQLLPTSEQVTMAKNGLLSEYADITKVGITIANLQCRLKKIKKK